MVAQRTAVEVAEQLDVPRCGGIGHDVLCQQIELGARFAGFRGGDLLQLGFDTFAQLVGWAACGVAL